VSDDQQDLRFFRSELTRFRAEYMRDKYTMGLVAWAEFAETVLVHAESLLKLLEFERELARLAGDGGGERVEE
jgi:hypothetical protein